MCLAPCEGGKHFDFHKAGCVIAVVASMHTVWLTTALVVIYLVVTAVGGMLAPSVGMLLGTLG